MAVMKHHENIISDSNNRFLMKSYFSTASVRSNEFRIHHHAECELCAILSGEGVYKVKNKTYSFNHGDIFLFSGDEEHCITDIYSQCELLNVHFTPRILWSEDLCLSRIFFARSKNFENKIDPQNVLTPQIFNSVIEIENECSKKPPGYRSMAKLKLLWIIAQLVRSYDYVDNTINYTSYRNSVSSIDTAMHYIDENLTQNLSLSDIAKHTAMNPTYFSAVFKKLNGISLWDYITVKRIELAIELLKTTNMTKFDIAMQCGFNSSSNFYKAFAKVTGKHPSDYT